MRSGRRCRVRSRATTTSRARPRCCATSPRTCARARSLRRRFTLTLGNSVPPAFWRDRPVLVTGATGLLGSALVRQLISAGADVVALIRDWVPRAGVVTSGPIGQGRIVPGDGGGQETPQRARGGKKNATGVYFAAQDIRGR